MKAQVKKYDPTQYNFENFANTMNKNYAIERSQNSQGGAFGAPTMPGNVAANANNPINWGSATNSQTLGNFGFNSILSGFKKSLDGFALGEQVSVDDKPPLPKNKGEEAILLDEPTSSPDVSFGGGINSSALTTFLKDKIESPRSVNNVFKTNDTQSNTDASTPASTYRPENTAYNELIKMYESGTTDINELSKLISEKYDEETVAAALDIFKTSYLPNVGSNTGYLSWLDGIKITETPDLTFEEWQSTYSVDPVQEYKYAQAQLDYEFKTWMSDYGARAEQLYQMGLSNSGVSDIYGANAYSAYIQSSMALKREQIKLQQENKRNYQTYLDEKKSAANTRIGTAYAAYESSYTPEGSQGIYNSLIGQGMSASEAAEVIRRLDAHYNTMPEDSRPDAVAANAKVDEAVTWLNSNYAYGMTDEELSKMLTSTYGAEVAQAALAKFAPFKEVIDRLSGDEAAKNAFSAMIDMLEAGDTDLESLKAKAKGLGYSDDAIAKAAENILPFVQSAGEKVNPQVVDAYTSLLSTYTKEQESNIRTIYKNLGWNDQDVNELISMLNGSIDANAQSIVDKTVSTLEATADVSPETIVMSTLIGNLKDYKLQLAAGDITQEQYDQYAKSFSDSAVKAYEWAVKSVNNMANAYAMFGYEEAEWAKMDDAARESAIMDAMAEYRKEGLISESAYSSLVSDWAMDEVNAYKEKYPNDYLESVGAVVYDLTTFHLSANARSEIIDTIIKKIGLDIDQLMLSWNVNGKVKKAGVTLKSSNKEATNVRGELLKAGYYSPYGTERYSVYNGVIYVSYDEAGKTWYEVGKNDIKFTGVSGIDSSDRDGIYAMVARVIETKLQRPKDTRR